MTSTEQMKSRRQFYKVHTSHLVTQTSFNPELHEPEERRKRCLKKRRSTCEHYLSPLPCCDTD